MKSALSCKLVKYSEEMALFQSVKESIGAVNGLGCLVQALEKRLITIDLENEMTVTGIVQEVDGLMNIVLNKAQLVNLDGYCQHYDMLYVRGRTIRYIHLPKQLSVRETISKYLKRFRSNRRPPEQDSSRNRLRQNKLQKYQEETRENIARIKASQPQPM